MLLDDEIRVGQVIEVRHGLQRIFKGGLTVTSVHGAQAFADWGTGSFIELTCRHGVWTVWENPLWVVFIEGED